jgi:hypothetical protein
VLYALAAQPDCPDALFHRLMDGWLKTWTRAFARDFGLPPEEVEAALNAVKIKVAQEAPAAHVDALRGRLTKLFPELFFQ